MNHQQSHHLFHQAKDDTADYSSHQNSALPAVHIHTPVLTPQQHQQSNDSEHLSRYLNWKHQSLGEPSVVTVDGEEPMTPRDPPSSSGQLSARHHEGLRHMPPI